MNFFPSFDTTTIIVTAAGIAVLLILTLFTSWLKRKKRVNSHTEIVNSAVEIASIRERILGALQKSKLSSKELAKQLNLSLNSVNAKVYLLRKSGIIKGDSSGWELSDIPTEIEKPTPLPAYHHEFLWFKRGKEKQEKKIANTMVLDQVKGRSIEYIEKPKGRQWRYNDRLLYLMKRTEDGTLSVVDIPATLETLPEDLYDALHDENICVWMVAKTSFWANASTIALWLVVAGMFILIVMMYGGGKTSV